MKLWNALTEKQKKQWKILVCALGITAGVSLSIATQTAVEKVKPAISAPPVTPRPSEVAARVVRHHLDAADAEAMAALDPHLAAVTEFFKAARSRTRAYGELVLGWDSKWTMTADVFRSEGDKQHTAFLETKFAETIFSKDELEQLVQQTVAGYMRQLDDIDSQAVVRIKADLDQLPAGSLPKVIDKAALQAVLTGALQEATKAAQAEFRAAVGREIVSWICSEVLTVAAIQLGASSTILGAGAASGYATFGVGVLVGLVVDAVVTQVYNSYADPVGKLAAMLNSKMSEMETLVLKGTRESPGLQGRLRDYTSRRNKARRQAVEGAVLTPIAL